MVLLIESTDEIVRLDGVECRLWRGSGEGGAPCLVFVHRIAVPDTEDSRPFDQALQSKAKPADWPARLTRNSPDDLNGGRTVNGCEVSRLEDGRVRLEVAGETIDAAPATWRAVLFNAQVREDLRAIVSRELFTAPIVSPAWWNGDGR